MKQLFSILIVLITLATSVQAQELKPFKDGDRAVFLGNSITHAGFYESYLWLYYMTHFPERKIEILNGGSGGDVVGQMNARFEDDILKMDPNIVILTFGMNDSGYFEFWQDSPEKTAKKRVKKSLHDFRLLQKKFEDHPEIQPVIMSSSPYDETAKIDANNFTGKSKTLEDIVKFQQEEARKNNWPYVDLYSPMLAITKNGQAQDSSYTITGPDRIHPGKPGHLVMAALFLKNQGLANQVVSKVEIDTKKAEILTSENASIYLLNANKNEISFQYEAKSLPYPIDSTSSIWNNPQKLGDALEVYPFIKEFNQEVLRVTNLEKGDYQLIIDGQDIAKFTSDSLSKGINMALLANTPQYKQAKNVMFLNEQRAEIEGKLREYYWAQSNYFRDKGLLYADTQEAYDMASTEKEGFIGSKMGVYRTVRFPEVRKMLENNIKILVDKIYEINQPKSHKIQLKAI
ncbi:SGNH/GDSL hydrolase family protein [Mesonia sp.]|uniref:SGNH/GDSL hydrolase family protein n=1 Tax=Mesonia sp. TaxID=1960830 RepID=UPI00175A696F|nr:SGNH/GDSL hydrolase family protein [Mesonia sp.]HIB38543.1 GDSL family lipase [Mesonia sp.]HIO26404.1 GDSL family lipase [Flavobacteriaceae bacterium]